MIVLTAFTATNPEGAEPRRFSLDEAFEYVCGGGIAVESSAIFDLPEAPGWECEIILRPKETS